MPRIRPIFLNIFLKGILEELRCVPRGCFCTLSLVKVMPLESAKKVSKKGEKAIKTGSTEIENYLKNYCQTSAWLSWQLNKFLRSFLDGIRRNWQLDPWKNFWFFVLFYKMDLWLVIVIACVITSLLSCREKIRGRDKRGGEVCLSIFLKWLTTSLRLWGF